MRNKRLLIIFGVLLSLTLLIAIGSAVFSIRTVTAYCYNYDDDVLIERVLQNKSKLMGKSIFALNEDALIEEVEKNVGGIKVINIERLFPNRVSINFIKLYDYFETKYNGFYYKFGIDGRIVDKQEESAGESVINVKFDLDEEPAVDGTLAAAKGFSALQSMTQRLENLQYAGSDSTVIIECIDFSFSDSTIYIKMRSGVLIKLLRYENADIKLWKALSLYMAKPDYRRSGTIIATDADRVDYSPYIDNEYEEGNL